MPGMSRSSNSAYIAWSLSVCGCAGDTALRQMIESLLLAHRNAESFLEIPALKLASRRWRTQDR